MKGLGCEEGTASVTESNTGNVLFEIRDRHRAVCIPQPDKSEEITSQFSH